MSEKECIYREDAIKAIDAHLSSILDGAEISAPSRQLYGLGHRHCKDVINSLPAAPVREVVRARWLQRNVPGLYGCSKCGCYACQTEVMRWNFCPNCGAEQWAGKREGGPT